MCEDMCSLTFSLICSEITSGRGCSKFITAPFSSPYTTSLITAVQGNTPSGSTFSPSIALIKVLLPFLNSPTIRILNASVSALFARPDSIYSVSVSFCPAIALKRPKASFTAIIILQSCLRFSSISLTSIDMCYPRNVFFRKQVFVAVALILTVVCGVF